MNSICLLKRLMDVCTCFSASELPLLLERSVVDAEVDDDEVSEDVDTD